MKLAFVEFVMFLRTFMCCCLYMHEGHWVFSSYTKRSTGTIIPNNIFLPMKSSFETFQKIK